MRRGKIVQIAKRWIIPPGIWQQIDEKFKRITGRAAKRNTEERRLLAKNPELRNRHAGSRCFIFGSGPSIKSQDISKLVGEHVISVSNTFVHPQYEMVQPRYHVLPPLLTSHGHLHRKDNFVDWLRAMEAATTGAEMIMHIGDHSLIEHNDLFRNRSIWWVDYLSTWDESFDVKIDLSAIPPIWSVSELAITAAVYLGYDKIYLIGIDHDWFNGVLVYFYDPATEHVMRPDRSDLGFADSEFQMLRHAKIFRKYKYLYSLKKNIYNANADPNHYLDVFPKVDFDSLF